MESHKGHIQCCIWASFFVSRNMRKKEGGLQFEGLQKKIPKNQKPQPNKKTPHLLQPEFWEDQFLCPLFYTSQTKANMFKSQVMCTGKQHLLMHREFWFKPDKAEKQWFLHKETNPEKSNLKLHQNFRSFRKFSVFFNLL